MNYIKFVLSICCIVLCLVLVSCKSENPYKLDPKTPTVISIWHYYHGSQKNAFDSEVNLFNETVGYEKGIIVEAISFGGVKELSDSILDSANGTLGSRDMPDIFGAYGDTAYAMLQLDKITAIDNYVDEKELAEYENSFIQEGKIGTNHLYVFPIAKSTESLLLNKTEFDIFVNELKKTKPNEDISYDDLSTWEGILRISDLYYEYTDSLTPEIIEDGSAFISIDSVANFLVTGMKQLGVDLVTVQDGKPIYNFDNTNMQKLWDTYYNSIVTGKFVKLGKFGSDDIKTGDTLCFIGSTTSAKYFPATRTNKYNQTIDIELKVLSYPYFESGKKIAISQGAGMVITKSTKQKEYAASIFLKWFTQTERNLSFSLNSAYLPVKTSSLSQQLFDAELSKNDSSDINLQNTIAALKSGISQINNFEIYYSPVFEGSIDFRYRLDNELLNIATQSRKEFLALIHNGKSGSDAKNIIFSQSHTRYEQWLESLKQ